MSRDEILATEIRHLARTILSFPAERGTFFAACLMHQVRELEGGETRRIFEVYAQEHEGRLAYSPFYIYLGRDRAALYAEPFTGDPPSERGSVWLCLEHLMGELRPSN